MAVASARENFIAAFGRDRSAEFEVTDCLQGIADESADLVLNNPPFHQQNTVGDAIAWKMFVEARRVLIPGGELWVVGNRHLAYHASLKKLFGGCELIASNRKFVVLRAIKQN
jgi:16S rRNA (guanine1207-N2)-methyltransferase